MYMKKHVHSNHTKQTRQIPQMIDSIISESTFIISMTMEKKINIRVEPFVLFRYYFFLIVKMK